MQRDGAACSKDQVRGRGRGGDAAANAEPCNDGDNRHVVRNPEADKPLRAIRPRQRDGTLGNTRRVPGFANFETKDSSAKSPPLAGWR